MSFDSSGRGGRRRRSEHPHPVDIHVGSRLRQRRQLLGMSQEKLGDAIGLTFQQVQKYERGANRIGASRLYELSRVLDVPVGFFFEDISRDAAPARAGLARRPAATFVAPPLDRDNLELVRLYQRISDSAVRRRLFDLAKAIADAYFPARSHLTPTRPRAASTDHEHTGRRRSTAPSLWPAPRSRASSGQRRLVAERLPQLRFELPAQRPARSARAVRGAGRSRLARARLRRRRASGGAGGGASRDRHDRRRSVRERHRQARSRDVERRGLANIRIFADDARALVAALGPSSIARAFILFPDPWPKERHKKRRSCRTAPRRARARDGRRRRTAARDRRHGLRARDAGAAHRSSRISAGSRRGPRDWRERAARLAADALRAEGARAGRTPIYLRFARRARAESDVPVGGCAAPRSTIFRQNP